MLRQNEKDIINLYNFLTPFIQLVTDSNMLNFGYWTDKTENPLQAQQVLCRIVGEFADLYSARNVLDVGSGFSSPATTWKKEYDFLDIVCVNINPQQLSYAAKITIPNNIVKGIKTKNIAYSSSLGGNYNRAFTTTNIKDNNQGVISLLNATATTLPFADHCVDRIIALESAQHFKPLINFIRESKRILKNDGLLVIAIPVTKTTSTAVVMRNTTTTSSNAIIQSKERLRNLGLLSLTWASEHYELTAVKSMLKIEGFEIQDIEYIGPQVYEPLAEYYVQSRKMLKNIIMKQYPSSPAKNILYSIIENIIYKSALKMKDLSKRRVIDYVLIEAG